VVADVPDSSESVERIIITLTFVPSEYLATNRAKLTLVGRAGTAEAAPVVTAGGPFSYIGGWSHRAMK